MEITDPRAIRAMAHPLRLELIELLGTVGPSTAAECARRLGSTQASCSYHLRLLAKYGFVEQAAPRGDGRERPWQLTDIEQSWSGHGPAAEQLERVFVQREADRIMAWQAAAGQQPEEWRDVGFVGGATLPLTAAEAVAVRDELTAVIEPYVARLTERTGWPEGYRFVRILLAGTPVGAETEENTDE
ncbi:winged helix-turn-helix domain-containing protein [Ornithinimicrobium sp. F0845]|uniref:ArsR/SmtB family transcription factor n=1 Tax=Ornithinimicrobium sp. F0845 TaxID=2926412 RepID=UPI001FF48519|nr:winged helix-turn-helix domain-containing protein [Ornithinimicrobium sp. F0845]MCK0112085.1 winged helix-turn-helix domain-containing protein [Ornithinimicrobium sp. F0845]